MRYGFGVDIGGTTVKLGFFDKTGTLLDKWEISTVTENHGEAILPDVADSIKTYLAKNKISFDAVIGIGLGVPGPMGSDGTVYGCHNLGWGTFSVRQAMEQLAGVPVRVGNDANLAALGESWKGSGCDNMVMVTLGTGVGGGIILNGRPVSGAHGAAGEIGHLVLERDETEVCNCGKRGCAEQYCSATGIVRLAKGYLENHDTPSVLRALQSMTCKDVFDAAKAQDSAAQEILEQVYSYLGQLLADVCCVIDPEMIVIGGGVSKAGQVLLDGASRYFQKYAFAACKSTRFALASLGNDAGIYGAWKLALDSLL